MDVSVAKEGDGNGMDELHNGSAAPGALSLPSTCEPPGEGNPAKELVWLIFGATGHMGRLLVHTALTHGDKVIAVGWSQEHNADELEQWQGDSVLWLLCDVRIPETVGSIMQQGINRWGRVDIVANCVGCGVIGACEDQDEAELRMQVDTNFFGTLHILQSSLPYFRRRQSGRYIIFSSTSGSLGVPGLGPYCATKYAVEGLVESMLYEVDCYNVKGTLVEPGHVRRDEPEPAPGGGDAIGLAPRPKTFQAFKVKAASAPYAAPTAPAGHAKRVLTWLNDRQQTSAVKSAELVWQLGHCSYPPLRLLLGAFAVESIRDRLRSITEEMEDWKHLHFPVTAPLDAAAGDADSKGTGARDDDNDELEGDADDDDDQDQDADMRDDAE